jgi:hypothetical protein
MHHHFSFWAIILVLQLCGRKELWTRLNGNLIVYTSKLEAAGWRPAVDTYAGFLAMMRTEDHETAHINDARRVFWMDTCNRAISSQHYQNQATQTYWPVRIVHPRNLPMCT